MPFWNAINRFFNPTRVILALILVLCAGCNLSKSDALATTEVPVATLITTEQMTGTPIAFAATERPTRTPISFGATERPTLIPLINTNIDINGTAQPTLLPVTSSPPLGGLCQIYTTYSGVDPRNNLSLRNSPSVSAPQIYRVPTNQNVFLVPGSGEIEAEGYHWLNVIYVQSPQMRYQGWMARDSFAANGVRDPSIATLRLVNAQSAC